MRIDLGRFAGGRGHVPDFLLARLGPAQVVIQAGHVIVFGGRGREAQQRGHAVAVHIVVEREFEIAAVQLPEGFVLVFVRGGHALQMGEHLLDDGLRYFTQHHIFLESLA